MLYPLSYEGKGQATVPEQPENSGLPREQANRFPVEADCYRSHLIRAVTDGDPFDPTTGEPTSWHREAEALTVHQWAQRWVAEKWPEPATMVRVLDAIPSHRPGGAHRGAGGPLLRRRAHGPHLGGWSAGHHRLGARHGYGFRLIRQVEGANGACPIKTSKR